MRVKTDNDLYATFSKRYFEARGFSIYYFANAVFNITRDQVNFLRALEDILGDLQTQWFMKPYKKYSNLHQFIGSVVESILFEDMHDDESPHSLLFDFSKAYALDLHLQKEISPDSLALAVSESEAFDLAMESLTDELFHILFRDLSFLFKFNKVLSQYIENAHVDENHRAYLKADGKLKRVSPPKWVRSAVFYRDNGECRTCKKSLAKIINQYDIENYDHLVPLVEFGTNDVANLQLLCVTCNTKKAGNLIEPSRLYQRIIQN